MKSPSESGAPSSPWLRGVHAAVFLSMAAGVLAVARPEWRHLLQALEQDFHVGPSPQPVLVVGSALAAIASARLLLGLALRRSAPMWASSLILGALALTVAVTAGTRPPERSEAQANLAFLRVARRVQRSMVDTLQQRGEVPVASEPWQQALAAAEPREDLVRTRFFQPRPPQLLRLSSPDVLPIPLVPGDLLVHVSEDGLAFDLRIVGFSQGQPSVLPDDTGAPLVLRGLFNPELPPAPPPSQESGHLPL